MQVAVEKLSNIERRLTITVPANQVEEAYGKQINKLVKTANIKGFRPGKAPISYIQQRFGEDARREAISEVMQNALYEALAQHQLRPISSPRIEPKVLVKDQPLEFAASFEVLPEIENINFAIASVEKLKIEVGAEDINHVIGQLRKQSASWKIVDRAAQDKDRVVIDYHTVFEGHADIANQVQNFPLELGSKNMLPGFEEGLIGVKAGDERTLSLSFPADFSVTEKAGKPIDFVVKVKQIFEADMPEIDEAFVRKLGIKSGTIEDLTTQIKQSLEQERDRLVQEKLKEQVFSQLLEQNPLEVPNSLIAREAKNIHDEMYPHQHNHHQHSDQELSSFNDVAKKRVTLGLLIAEYAKQKEIKTDPKLVIERIKEIASVYEDPQQVIAWLSSDERRAGIEAQVLENQVLAKLIEGIAVTEKSMSYSEIKGIRI